MFHAHRERLDAKAILSTGTIALLPTPPVLRSPCRRGVGGEVKKSTDYTGAEYLQLRELRAYNSIDGGESKDRARVDLCHDPGFHAIFSVFLV
jgi:hypothetical protein